MSINKMACEHIPPWVLPMPRNMGWPEQGVSSSTTYNTKESYHHYSKNRAKPGRRAELPPLLGFKICLGIERCILDFALMTKTQQQLWKTLHIQRMGTAEAGTATGPLCLLLPKHLPIKTSCNYTVTGRDQRLSNQRILMVGHEQRERRVKK